MRLQGRKRRLEDDVARLEAELCERKAEVEQAAKKLCPLPEPIAEPGSSELACAPAA